MTNTVDRPTIVVVGSANMDLVAYVSRVPGPGETLVGDRFAMGFGGKGANQAVMARLLGADVAMIACLGDDAYGDMTVENFASHGINTAHVRRVSEPSGVAQIWVEADGMNRIIVLPGANDALTPSQAASAVGDVPDVDVVVGQLEVSQESTKAAFVAAREREAITILNPAPASPLDADLIAASTWIIPNEVEFEAMTGRQATDDDALVDFARESGSRLLVTLGKDGVAFVSGDDVIRTTLDEIEATDTTGAGDAFVGAFAYGLAAGMSELDAITLGNTCAGESVTKAGAQTSYPDRVRSAEILRSIGD